jgi:demethylmenaquinone methyltransferase/2-methoxy-6-polyprenyl-1,4-benzoquinol methylase
MYQGSDKAGFVKSMFASIAERYDLMNSILSFGIHKIWKRCLIAKAKDLQPKAVLDLCTGTGDLLPGLAEFSERVVGADFCAEMLELSTPKIRHLETVELELADAMKLKFESQMFDLVTVAFGVRNFQDLEQGLKEIRRVLKDGGSILVLEFGQPQNPFFKQVYDFYSALVLPLLGRMIAGNKEAYRYLKTSAGAFPCREKFLDILLTCGFHKAEYQSLTGGIAYIYSASTLIETD